VTSRIVRATSRRRFLQYLAASPLLASSGLPAWGEEAPSKLPDPMIWTQAAAEPIKNPKEAINVFDFEPAAFKNVPPAHFGYMASGLDDELTLRANREGFLKFQLLPRRLHDVSKVDMSVEIFGTKYDSPIFVCPTGGNQFFHPDGELAAARAARAGNHLQILSTSSNYSVEDVTKARGAPLSGSSSTRRRALKWQRPSSRRPRPPVARCWRSRPTGSRGETRRRCSG
jgi:4-hydroxymandelate oxidase